MITFGSPNDWKAASFEIQSRAIGVNKQQGRFRHDSKWTSDGSLKQIELYCLLKASFGPPNGLFMAARAPQSGNFIEWHYVLTRNGVVLQLLGSSSFLELWLQSDDAAQTSDIDWQYFSKSIIQTLEANRQLIAEQKAQLEKWDVFLNTHWRLVQLLDHYHVQFSKVVIHLPRPLPHVATKAQLSIYNQQMKKLGDAVFQKRNAGLVVRMLVPVALESLVNLTILVLAVPSVRKDDRLLEDCFRKAIDIRLKTLHLVCQGLQHEINQNDDRFKQVLRVMQSRNDLLHGNVEPHTNALQVVFFDGTIPLLPAETDISVQFASETLYGVEDDKVSEDYNSIKGLRTLIVDALSPNLRKGYEAALDNTQLGWRKDTRRIGILFNNTLMQSFLIRKS